MSPSAGPPAGGPAPEGKVVLTGESSATSLFGKTLLEAADRFPDTFNEVRLPTQPSAFRKAYGQALPAFEAARLGSNQRLEIARSLIAALESHIAWQDAKGTRPLRDALAEPADPLALSSHHFDGPPGWEPSLLYKGERFAAARLDALGSDLVQRGMASNGVGAALGWLVREGLTDGRLNLTGRKIALLGAGAEMAPTRFWLEAGADVLWLDVAAPPAEWRQMAGMSGTLHWPEGSVDLLSRPQEVLATIRAFAAGQPVDLGLYAYAPGQARELLLTATMNAIVDALAPDLLASVTLLVSPTTPTTLSEDDQAAMAARLAARPVWEAALAAVGLLGRGGGCAVSGSAAATRSVVTIQGGSYQAAQYLGKVLAAECWAADGSFRVSANTAAITRTRSLDHPVFTAAFGGAAAFAVETFTPRLSRRLNGLLAAKDWLAPEQPLPGSVRVHGGIHSFPYPLDRALRVAAAIGFARSPRLLQGLLGSR